MVDDMTICIELMPVHYFSIEPPVYREIHQLLRKLRLFENKDYTVLLMNSHNVQLRFRDPEKLVYAKMHLI